MWRYGNLAESGITIGLAQFSTGAAQPVTRGSRRERARSSVRRGMREFSRSGSPTTTERYTRPSRATRTTKTGTKRFSRDMKDLVGW